MTTAAHRFASAGLAAVVLFLGCSMLRAGDGPRRWSAEWYAARAELPVGARQHYRGGKLWPPFPRPIGEREPCLHQFHAAHYWPHPYVCFDRQYVREVAHLQVANGWIAETTLYDYHFLPGGELNHSGRLHLQWILENAPPEHRFVWVETAHNAAHSQARLAQVHAAAVDLVGEANLPPIMLRVASAYGRPGDEVRQVREGYLNSMPVPRIEVTPLPGAP